MIQITSRFLNIILFPLSLFLYLTLNAKEVKFGHRKFKDQEHLAQPSSKCQFVSLKVNWTNLSIQNVKFVPHLFAFMFISKSLLNNMKLTRQSKTKMDFDLMF